MPGPVRQRRWHLPRQYRFGGRRIRPVTIKNELSNRGSEGFEVIEDRTGGGVANRVRLEDVFAVGAAQRLYRQAP